MNMKDVEDPASSLSQGRNPEAGVDRNYASNNSAIPWIGKWTRSFWHSVRSTINLLESCDEGSRDLERLPFHKRSVVFMIFVLVSMSVDAIFLYVPLVNDDKKCIELDKRLGITAVVLRSVIDLFYGCYFTSKFFLFSKCSYLYLIYILAILPLPQVITLSRLPEIIVSKSFNITDLLKFVILFQYLPRICMIYPLLKKVTMASTKSVGHAKVGWIKAAVDFSIYMLVSHVFGAFWYLLSIGRVTRCWQAACTNFPRCVRQSVYCDIHSEDNTYLIDACPIESPDASIFNFGIYIDALQSGVVSSKDFPAKLSYCFWWGLQNLSSIGQNLQTSTYFWENCFAVFISIFGLAAFLLFIGKVQIYLQSKTIRQEDERQLLEQARLKEEKKRKEKINQIEHWLTSYALTHDLEVSIKQHLMNEWLYNGGANLLVFTEEVNLKNVLHDLTPDLWRKLIHFLTRRLLNKYNLKFPLFQSEGIFEVLCNHLKPEVLPKGYCFVREGQLLDKMILIMQGTLNTYTSTGEINDSLSCASLGKGNIFGEKLITWMLDSPSSKVLPDSSYTVQASDNVEGFLLTAEDLKKIIISKYWWKISKKIDRSNLAKWQPMAASVIGSAVARHIRKKAKIGAVEESSSNGKETEELTVLDMLPPNLKQQIKQCQQCSWNELHDSDMGTLLRKLPPGLRRVVKCHLCLVPLKNVPLFMKMGDKWLDKLCDNLRPVHYTERGHIIRERDPILEMVFMVRGKLWGYSTTEAKYKYFSNGSCYGEELVKWAEAGSKAKLPTATITIQACSDVEAFTLPAGVLKLLVGQQNMGQKPYTTKAAFSRYKGKGYGSKKDEDLPSKIINDSQANDISDSQTGTSSQGNLPVFAESKSKEIDSDAEQDPEVILK